MPPPNNQFASATVLTGASGAVTGTNVFATTEFGEPFTVGKTVWWKWTCPADGNYFFTTEKMVNAIGTNFKTKIAVYVANNPASPAVNDLSQVTYLLDQHAGIGLGVEYGAEVAFAATNGTVYYIQVESRTGDEGPIALTWGVFNAPWLSGCGDCIEFAIQDQCWTTQRNCSNFLITKTSFGTFPKMPGWMTIRYCSGQHLAPTLSWDHHLVGVQTFNASSGSFTFVGEQWSDADLTAVNNAMQYSFTGLMSGIAGTITMFQDYIVDKTSISASYVFDTVTFYDASTSLGNFTSSSARCATLTFVNGGGEIFAPEQDIKPTAVLGHAVPESMNNITIDSSMVSETAQLIAWTGSGEKFPNLQSAIGYFGHNPFFTYNSVAPYNWLEPMQDQTTGVFYTKDEPPNWKLLPTRANSANNPTFKLFFTSIASCLQQMGATIDARSNISGSFFNTQTGLPDTGLGTGVWGVTVSIKNISSLTFNGTVLKLRDQTLTNPSAPVTVNLTPGSTQSAFFTFNAPTPDRAFVDFYFNTALGGTFVWNIKPILVVTSTTWNCCGTCASQPFGQVTYVVKNVGYCFTKNLKADIAVYSTTGLAPFIHATVCPPTTVAQTITLSDLLSGAQSSNIFRTTWLGGSTTVVFQITIYDDYGGKLPPVFVTGTL